MRRIMIVGGSGSGKSTLGRALGEALDLPIYHLDRIYWGPAWTRLSQEDREAALARIFALPGYVLEGGSPATYDARLADCDTLIWLDLNPVLRLVRIWARIGRNRGRSRPDLPPDSPEDHPGHVRRFWPQFWRGLPQERALLADLVARAAPGIKVVRLNSRRAVRGFLAAHGARARVIAAEK